MGDNIQHEREDDPRIASLLLFVVFAVLALLSLRSLNDSSIGIPDADRILMDGVFIHDFLLDLPLTQAFDYAVAYYGQYPALSIGYHPPFFPFVEAIFNLIFGVNMWSSRLALLAFSIVGIAAWFALLRRIFDTATAFWASLILVSTPFVTQWGWYTMTEVPALSMAMVTAFVFYHYLETEQARYLYATALLFSLTLWTKQTALFLVIWFVMHIVVTGQFIAVLKRKETWVATGIVLVLVVPLLIITLWLGKQNLDQSVGANISFWSHGRLNWDNLSRHLSTLINIHLTVPVLVLSIIGMALAVYNKHKATTYFFLLIISVYMFFTYIIGKNPRYPIFWIPAFALFACLPVYYLQDRRRLHILLTALVAGTIIYQIAENFSRSPAFAKGYREAAEFVLKNRKNPVVFVDAYNNGYFTYFMRALDADRSMYVLRGDKLLTSASISSTRWLKIHANNRSDIEDILKKYGVTLIVVERNDYTGIAIHKELREFLKTNKFQLLREIPIVSNRRVTTLAEQPSLGMQTLQIYEYVDAVPLTAEELIIELPIVGQTLRVPLGEWSLERKK